MAPRKSRKVTKLYCPSTKKKTFLETILRIKEVEYEYLDNRPKDIKLVTKDDAILIDDDIPIVGVMNIAIYLNERHPLPELIPGEPDRRATIRYITDLMIETTYPNHDVADVKKVFKPINEPDKYILETISLLDLAIYPLVRSDKEWTAHKNSIENRLAG